MDLRTQFPRSVREPFGGYVHLARMIDKCRALQAGTLGEYIYPCPLDQRLIDFAGITSEHFLQAVKSRNDHEILEWFKANSTPHSPEEIDAWNHMMLSRGQDSDEKWEYFRKIRDGIDPTRTDIASWADLLDLEEQRPVPLRNTPCMED